MSVKDHYRTFHLSTAMSTLPSQAEINYHRRSTKIFGLRIIILAL
jgi:hypothetical protein